MRLLRAVVASVALAAVVGNILRQRSFKLPKRLMPPGSNGELTVSFPIDILPVDPCNVMRSLLRMDYTHMGSDEPDLNRLTLEFTSRAFMKSYNINAAAKLILKTPEYDPSKGLFIFLHGFIDDPGKNSYYTVSEALLNHGEFNVLALDASSLIRWLYVRSSTYVRFIGKKLGKTLATLYHSVDPKRIYLIGHSLGAHTAGFTGKTFTELTGQRIGRITGLDPAGPCFTKVLEMHRINPNDADYVDIIHTDNALYGLTDACGHADYFVNGGYEQPNCMFRICSHSRAWELYAESVMNHKAFPAVKCNNWGEFRDERCNYTDVSYMGFGSSPGTTGQYYVQTNGKPPFGRGEDGLKYNYVGLMSSIARMMHIS